MKAYLWRVAIQIDTVTFGHGWRVLARGRVETDEPVERFGVRLCRRVAHNRRRTVDISELHLLVQEDTGVQRVVFQGYFENLG